MGIWEILGIAPTTNIRQIKKAYAAKSREVHPEEKPEEFRMLHEAYQKALQYAKKPDNRTRSKKKHRFLQTERKIKRQETGPNPQNDQKKEQRKRIYCAPILRSSLTNGKKNLLFFSITGKKLNLSTGIRRYRNGGQII